MPLSLRAFGLRPAALLVGVVGLCGPPRALATHAICPTPVDFAFLDLDGNLCHDPGDTGDVGPQLVTGLFAPAAGSLVCSANRIVTVELTEWHVPGDVVLDCTTTFTKKEKLNPSMDAGGRLFINGKARNDERGMIWTAEGEVRVAADLTGGVRFFDDIGEEPTIRLESRMGPLTVMPRRKITCANVQLASAETLILGAGARLTARGFANGPFEIDVSSAADVIVEDRVKVAGSYQVSFAAAGELTIGEGVRLTARRKTLLVDTQVALQGARITVGPRSRLEARDRIGDIQVVATGPITLDGVELRGAADFEVRTTDTAISFRDGRLASRAAADQAPRVAAFETAPGGVCDLTGTAVSGNVTLAFTGCTVVGLGG